MFALVMIAGCHAGFAKARWQLLNNFGNVH
jgi:hypothetical protein